MQKGNVIWDGAEDHPVGAAAASMAAAPAEHITAAEDAGEEAPAAGSDPGEARTVRAEAVFSMRRHRRHGTTVVSTGRGMAEDAWVALLFLRCSSF